jgi:hypothetical protein
MGIMEPYFPTEMAIKLSGIAGADTFIETGTYMGGTTKWASTQFKKVHTIELSEKLYNQFKDELIIFKKEGGGGNNSTFRRFP